MLKLFSLTSTLNFHQVIFTNYLWDKSRLWTCSTHLPLALCQVLYQPFCPLLKVDFCYPKTFLTIKTRHWSVILLLRNLVLGDEANDLVTILLVEVDPNGGPGEVRSLHPTCCCPLNLKHSTMSKFVLWDSTRADPIGHCSILQY